MRIDKTWRFGISFIDNKRKCRDSFVGYFDDVLKESRNTNYSIVLRYAKQHGSDDYTQIAVNDVLPIQAIGFANASKYMERGNL